jgi:flagellar protein FlbD
MIAVTKLDGSPIFINELNIQWIESLPDTSITFVGGARLIILEKPHEIVKLMGSEFGTEIRTNRQTTDSAKPLP